MEKKETTQSNPKAQAQPRKVRIAIPEEDRLRMVAEAAYYIAEKRGSGSDPTSDWIAAEKEIEELLMDTKSSADGR